MSGVYYNEFDPKAAAWLRQLMTDGLIPEGEVDERSIVEVQAEDVRGYSQCHFFAGIGGWAEALRLAGADDLVCWTGSCPCQPLSGAGKRRGHRDERHLWPEFHRLIRECRPERVFGEQVASKLGREWLDGISLDLEALGYAVGSADLCAACVGEKGHPLVQEVQEWVRRSARSTPNALLAERLRLFADYLDGLVVASPQIRQRLWWVADSTGGRLRVHGGASGQGGHTDQCGTAGGLADAQVPERGRASGTADGRRRSSEAGRPSPTRGLADATCRRTKSAQQSGCWSGPEQHGGLGQPLGPRQRGGNQPRPHPQGREVGQQEDGACAPDEPCDGCEDAGGGLGDTERTRLEGHAGDVENRREPGRDEADTGRPVAETGGTGFWSAYDLIPCQDGKARRVEPGTFPLAHGVPGRVGLLRGYGNAIVPQVAAAFIQAYLGED